MQSSAGPIFKMALAGVPPCWIFPEVKFKVKPVTETSLLDPVPNFVRINAIRTGMAVKVNFKMAAAAILNFLRSEI